MGPTLLRPNLGHVPKPSWSVVERPLEGAPTRSKPQRRDGAKYLGPCPGPPGLRPAPPPCPVLRCPPPAFSLLGIAVCRTRRFQSPDTSCLIQKGCGIALQSLCLNFPKDHRQALKANSHLQPPIVHDHPLGSLRLQRVSSHSNALHVSGDCFLKHESIYIKNPSAAYFAFLPRKTRLHLLQKQQSAS